MDGETMLVAIIAIVCVIGLPVVLGIMICKELIKSRHEERMAMIEKGTVLQKPESRANRYPALRNGLVMVGLAFGLLVGIMLYPVIPAVEDWLNLSIPIMGILFSGLAFIVYFFLSRRMQLKEKQEDNNV